MSMGGEKNRNLIHNTILVAAIILGVAVSFFLFYRFNRERIAGQNESYILDITTQRAELIDDLFDQ